MKKFTLTLIAALFVVLGASAQELSGPVYQKEPVKIPVGFKPEKPNKNRLSQALQRRVAKENIASYVPLGGFTWSCLEYDGSVDYVDNPVIIKELGSLEEDGKHLLLVTISGMFAGYDLTAKVYPDYSFEILPGQSVFKYYSYDFVLTAIDDDFNELPITGSIVYDDKDFESKVALVFDESISALIRKDRKSGSMYYPLYYYGQFDRDASVNGIMELTLDDTWSTGEKAYYPVTLTQKGNIVTIDRFLESMFGAGAQLKVTLNADKTITIPNQIVYEENYGGYYLRFYTWAADYTYQTPSYYEDFITGPTISGKGSGSEISWGNFMMYEPEYGYSLGSDGCFASAKVYYVNGSGERYNYVASDASAPRFNFDQNLTGIQNAKTAEAVGVSYVDMAGRQVTAATKGVVLKTTKYADGSKKTVKVVRK